MALMTADWTSVRRPAAVDRLPGSADELEPLARVIGDRVGLDFPAERSRSLQSALAARLRSTGCSNLGDYARLLTALPWEWDRLTDLLTVGETEFFRQPEVFEALRASLLPSLVLGRARSGRPALRIWSAGCSEGDEAYSLAMLAHAALPEPWLWDVRITGTDLSAGAIEAARLGRYRAERLRRTPDALRRRYVEPARDGAPADQVIGSELRALVRFRQLNLVGPYWPMASQDLVVCQNVLYYLRPAARALVLERLFRSLALGGYLIVGPAEAPTEPLFGTVRPVVVDGVRAYRRA